ncbi:MAG: response regulator [Candidatus Electrothrix sp. LOE1_4_5]|nr:response regulator [Candidatus Electrothrix sp. AX1]MCI5116835.1 response regulator [Candidatus Electrothrix gigas]MCI5178322.1 response regulator [Candidatus Electrothrix gigas]MCI5180949.1 response regulator [Candidatus Electrothrix gigas]MCI5190844.1 response regulator [Candidatus Electrothrix gigas]
MERHLMAPKVLLVDDEEEFANLLARRLETRGIQVVAVSSGEEAVSLVDQRVFDVAVIDLSMPGIDGIETLKQIKAKRSDIEVLMLTGHATVAGGIEAMKQGASDFLQKPVEIEELLKKINKARQSHLAVVHQKADAAMQEILKRKSW